MKTWQIFYKEKKDDGTWWTGKRPLRILIDKEKADNYYKTLKKKANINQDYVMYEIG